MNIQKIKPLKFTGNSLVLPDLQWTLGTSPVRQTPDSYCVSLSWDGHATAYPVSPQVKKLPASKKPRMWQCPRTRLWHCQRHWVRGSGTTKRYAYESLMSQLVED